MAQSLAHLARPGTKLTRTKLREMLNSAATPPRMNPGLYGGVIGTKRQAAGTITVQKRHPIKSQKEIDVLITSSVQIPGFPNRYDYQWSEARLSALNVWQILPGGRTHATLGVARNLAEVLNTGAVVAHGVTIPTPPPTVTMLAIPNLTPVTVRLLRDVNGVSRPWFSEVNAINVVC